MNVPCSNSALFVCVLSAIAVAPGCGTESASTNGASSANQSAATPDAAAASAAAETPQGPAGTLRGSVTFAGDPIPEQTMIPIVTDPEHCERHGKDGLYPKEDYVIDKDTRGVRNVIVYLMGDALRDQPKQAREDIVIDNRDCRFEPHALVSVVGSSCEVKNSDEVYHTTHLYGPPGFVEFNPGMRQKGDSEKTVLTRPGIYQVKCDRHGWMSAYLRVDTHPFHAVTDEKGQFEIAGIPPGKYQVGMFHEMFRPDTKDPQPIEVVIEADKTAAAELKLSP
jgi:plastocyanin